MDPLESAERGETGPERNSPSSPVCYLDLSDYHTSAQYSSLDESLDKHDDTPTPGRTSPLPSGDESDHTPRSEIPSVAQSPAPWNVIPPSQPQTAISEVEYFSSQATRAPSTLLPPPAHENLHRNLTSNSSSHDNFMSRPEFEIVSGGHARLSPTLEPVDRPELRRDSSNASTISNSTVRAGPSGSHARLDEYIAKKEHQHPQYPDQAYSALHSQVHPLHVRTKNLRPTQPSYSASHVATLGAFPTKPQYQDFPSRTVGNTPAGSPGLFSPSTPPIHQTEAGGYYASPYLHPSHLHAPRETHRADVSVDSVSGIKRVNDYEILDELGRGVHGKVKLGRNVHTRETIAIKIIDRNAKRRRLGKNDSHEEKIRREVAILKKVRHPNIVSLLEVIDDPKAKKVYLVLEHVELGEVKWRTTGAPEIVRVEYRRFQREAQGIFHNDAAAIEDEQILNRAAKRREKLAIQKMRKLQRERMHAGAGLSGWSLEHGDGDASDEELDMESSSMLSKSTSFKSMTRVDSDEHAPKSDGITSSRPSEVSLSSHQGQGQGQGQQSDFNMHLEGTMYGAYDPELPRGRTPSVTGSSNGGSVDNDDLDNVPDHFHYVPLMTIAAARSAIRDTVLGLEYLHYQNVIHRDIKPANLLQTRDHRIKISDFGVSYLGRIPKDDSDGYTSESDVPDEDDANFDNPIDLAKTVGTPAFFPPELCDFDPSVATSAVPVTQAIDVWALGVTLYCLIFGRVPFYTENISKWAIMPVIAKEEAYIPRRRLKAVDERASSRPDSHGRVRMPSSSHRRGANDLEHEDVDDDLYDLLKRLLIKDPRKRIQLKEVKRHPWLLQDLPNKVAWVDETEPERQMKGKRIEVDLTHEDLNQAVIPINALRQLYSSARKTIASVGNAFTMARSGSSRRRAKSSATSDGPPSTRSSSSTISQDARKIRDERRPSLRLEEQLYQYHALRQSREPEHPLSQSQTASPEGTHQTQYFRDVPAAPISPYVKPLEESTPLGRSNGSPRPTLGNRAQSVMSTTTSIKTIRQSDYMGGNGILSQPTSPAAAMTDNHKLSKRSSFMEPVRRGLRSIKSRDRMARKTVSHNRDRSFDRFVTGDSDAHAGPSVAWSNTVAAGHVEQPIFFRGNSPKSHLHGDSPKATLLHPSTGRSLPSRQSSTSSMASHPSDAAPAFDNETFGRRPASSYLRPNDSIEDQIQRAKDEQRRRLLLEESRIRQRSDSNTQASQSPNDPASPCAPSPGDMICQQRPDSSIGTSPASQSLGPSSVVSSSSEDQMASGISQSTSNPSIPSVMSASSSVAANSTVSMDASKFSETSLQSSNVYDSEGFAGDVLESGDEDHEEDSDEEEDFIVMRKKKPLTLAPRNDSVPGAELARRRKNMSLGEVSQKSTRSGSGGTLRKLRSQSTPEEEAAQFLPIVPASSYGQV